MNPWYFFCCWSEQTVEQIIELPMIWDAKTFTARHHNDSDRQYDLGVWQTTVNSIKMVRRRQIKSCVWPKMNSFWDRRG